MICELQAVLLKMAWWNLKNPPWKSVWCGSLSWWVMVAAIHHGSVVAMAGHGRKSSLNLFKKKKKI